VGLGGLLVGVTGPLISAFIPLVRDVLGDRRTAIGVVMAIDNVMLLLLVPWAGALSDRASAGARGRLPVIVVGLLLVSAGMTLLATSVVGSLVGLVTAMVVAYAGINAQRAPFQALVADLVPSRSRSLAAGSVTFQMCVGAIVFLMLGRMMGREPAFLAAAGTVLVIAMALAFTPREQPSSGGPAAEATFRSIAEAAWSAVRGVVPGVRAIFVATLLMQLTFQTFTTWYALHATERFGIRPEDATIGFIAWAVGGVIGALPAGVIGVRIGRRSSMLLGFTLMAASLFALDRITSAAWAAPLLALASASWTLPMVNAYPLFVEPVAKQHRGFLSAFFLLSMALGGAIGDPMNGALFDRFGGYRPLFAMMAVYTVLAFVTVLLVPRGAGEAEMGQKRVQVG
jgi:MFS family permease